MIEAVMGMRALNVDDDDDEDVPITEQIKVPTTTTPCSRNCEVEDEEEVEETVIESTETDQKIVKIIEVEEEFDDVDVPFAVIEDVPIYPGCEKSRKIEKETMFSRTNKQAYSKKL